MGRTSRPEENGSSTPVRALPDLTRRVQVTEGFPELLAALRNGHAGTIDGAWGSAAPLACAAVGLHAPTTLVVVVAHAGDLDDFALDLASFSGIRPELFPAAAGRGALDQAEPPSSGTRPPPDEITGQRLRVLKRLASGLPPRLILTTMPALMQPVPRVEALRSSARSIRVGEALTVDDMARWLVDRGWTRVEVVEVAGEFSLRGGILDICPLDGSEPVRLEWFGDEVESIRPFDPESQRSLDRWDNVTLAVPPPLELARPETLGHAADYFPDGTWTALVEPVDLKDQARQYLGRLEDIRGLFGIDATWARLARRPSVAVSAVATRGYETTCVLRTETVERFSGDLARVKGELDAAAVNERVLIACHNQAEVDRLREVLGDTLVAEQGRLDFTVGRLRSGFHWIDERLLVLSDHELFARVEVHRAGLARRRYESRAIDSFLDLNEGDLVVHLSQGIAIYRGLQVVDKDAEHGEEQLVLEFAEGARLYVPIAQIELVQKYVGGGRSNPPLSRIGSSAWEKRKKRVAAAVIDLASELLQIQAARATQPGIAYPAEDTHWQTSFEAAFPYEETPDQLRAIEAIKADMARPVPMDRLLCGDVGYGKTEVAMRAAFKAVEAGKQVAVLVPTTVLAEQHHRTFSARMAEFPFRIEAVHRFRSRRQIRESLELTRQGAVDILIGTHRLVQKDVAFKDLGLVIIDEEQRFGVEDKEWLKSLRATVDVLTLSATPIPRTLHMSLVGIRDISNLETPPPDRKAIETRIGRWDDQQIRRAIRRELEREGQVYFVHNRIYDIESIRDKLLTLVPEARIVIGHGQMPGDDLEQVMLRFIQKQADVLLSTTIIESGLDIPNANTIFVHEADRYGLADLHQLRGRVGRYKNRAYAYLIAEQDKALTPGAVKRLKAIEEFTDLGAGFKIAIRDLEIRGAGNILGAEQSGHIEAVGYELYCSLLESAVRMLKNEAAPIVADASIELGWRAYLPRDYVPGPKVKVELYRRLSRLKGLDELADFRQELLDRFGGPLPPPAEHLLIEAELRILASRWGITRLHIEDEFAVLSFRDRRRVQPLAHPDRLRIVDERTAYVPLPARRPPGAIVAERVRSILTGVAQTAAPAPRPVKAPSVARATENIGTGVPRRLSGLARLNAAPARPGSGGRGRQARSEPAPVPGQTEQPGETLDPAESGPTGLGARLRRRKAE